MYTTLVFCGRRCQWSFIKHKTQKKLIEVQC